MSWWIIDDNIQRLAFSTALWWQSSSRVMFKLTPTNIPAASPNYCCFLSRAFKCQRLHTIKHCATAVYCCAAKMWVFLNKSRWPNFRHSDPNTCVQLLTRQILHSGPCMGEFRRKEQIKKRTGTFIQVITTTKTKNNQKGLGFITDRFLKLVQTSNPWALSCVQRLWQDSEMHITREPLRSPTIVKWVILYSLYEMSVWDKVHTQEEHCSFTVNTEKKLRVLERTLFQKWNQT